jgi:hypothetical protein
VCGVCDESVVCACADVISCRCDTCFNDASVSHAHRAFLVAESPDALFRDIVRRKRDAVAATSTTTSATTTTASSSEHESVVIAMLSMLLDRSWTAALARTNSTNDNTNDVDDDDDDDDCAASLRLLRAMQRELVLAGAFGYGSRPPQSTPPSGSASTAVPSLSLRARSRHVLVSYVRALLRSCRDALRRDATAALAHRHSPLGYVYTLSVRTFNV